MNGEMLYLRQWEFECDHEECDYHCEDLDDGDANNQGDEDGYIWGWSNGVLVVVTRRFRKSMDTYCNPPGLRRVPPIKSQKNLR